MLSNENGKPVWTYEGEAPEVGKPFKFKAGNGVTYIGKPVEVDEDRGCVTFDALTAKK